MATKGSVVLTLLLLLSSTCVHGQPTIAAGRIKVASGAAVIVRQRTEIPAHTGQVVFQPDRLKTGPDGQLGLTLNDETRVSLGPNSEVRLDRFVYAPAEGQLALVLSILRGLATYVSGRIARLSPDSIRLETPAAIIGVRGTRRAIRVETK